MVSAGTSDGDVMETYLAVDFGGVGDFRHCDEREYVKLAVLLVIDVE